ncbi:rod shape-determining protein MreC [Fusobacterium sp. MFO224]|uniref:rod shape-determining protein MreC n=1 Tax=Fusobacterium sp. MFO224 TaxID=3378070 RepID=UPI003852C8CD
MKIRRKKKTIMGWIYSFIIFILIIFFLRGIVLFGLKKINMILLPVQSKIYTTSVGVRETFEILTKYKEIFKENIELKKKLALVEYQDELLKNFAEENERLRKLLKIKEETRYKTLVAKISFQNIQELYTTFSIKLGEQDGVKVNMPILIEKTLIGKIVETSAHYSKVRMITANDSYVSCLAENKILGILSGNTGESLYFKPTSTLESDLKIGEEIYTSGISDVYPKGLYVGKIKNIISENNGLEKIYEIENNLNIYNLNEVIVITGE